MRVNAALCLVVGATLAATTVSTPAPAPAPAATEDEALERARGAVRALTSALLGRLGAALEEGDTAAALEVCGDVAQDVSARVREETGVDVSRTSLRLRNPANRPDAYERAWLEAHAGDDPVDTSPVHEVVADDDGARELRYLQPIAVGPMCLQCHGPADRIDRATRAVLAERYPDDRATGYREGDLRGVVSVRVPLAGPDPAR